MEPRNGILSAGSWILDQVKIIDQYPAQDALANILSNTRGNGGAPYNVLKNLARLKATFSLEGVGLIGDDENGRIIQEDCKAHGIATSHLVETPGASTSYTDVMSVRSTGRRTFFHARGANALLGEELIGQALQESNARLFHLGYLLLLDRLDEIDEHGETGASRVFKQASARGFITSADVVSEASDRFKTVVPPVLPHLDVLFVNEYEAERITGLSIGKGRDIELSGAEDAAIALLEMGVRKWVILHFTEGAMAISRQTGTVYQPAVKVPEDQIVGSAGAGDAFAAGVLMGLHEGWHIQECLRLGVCAAASSLFAAGCSDGVLPADKALKLGDQLGFYSY